MAPTKVTASLILSVLAATVQSHGHVSAIVADGVEYPGAIPANTSPDSPGWTASNLDNGFVEPASFSSADIVCHKEAKAPTAYAKVAAGGSVTLQWNTWPESHKGPVIDYLASCNGECASANKESLSFVKIAEKGYISGSNPGTWAADELISNGNSWTVEIPASIAPGKYVLRHEIIALHAAGQSNGAQAYPQCINLEITGSGSTTPSGEPATSLYTASDPGILFDLYQSFSSYDIPGPAVFSG